MASRNYLFGLVTSLALGGNPAAPADEPQKVPVKTPAPAQSSADAPLDEELLEFLGSVDTGDEDWVDYLTETDIATVAKPSSARGESEVKNDE